MNKRAILVFGFLVGVGSLQIVAEMLTLPKVKALAAATQVSPAMKVFTAHQGYETHAARFALSWRDAKGSVHELQLDPKTYASVRGPYNRRNVYGAALAYGPLLRSDANLRPMQDSVMRYAFCDPGIMRAELGVPSDAVNLQVHITPVRELARHDLELSWEVRCHA